MPCGRGSSAPRSMLRAATRPARAHRRQRPARASGGARGSRARHSLAAVRRGVLHDRLGGGRHRRPLALPRSAFALLGPTASGKSRLAVSLAEKLPLEIVSVDSAQVYRGMDIGTAKPSVNERARVPHHLIDIVDSDQGYSTGRWRADAIRVVLEIFQRHKIPLLVGGTMLYYRALV